MTNYYKKININIFILIITISLFSLKWILSYYFFKDDISLKVIFDTPGDGFFIIFIVRRLLILILTHLMTTKLRI